MNRDEIWDGIKREKETVYGQSMLEAFLATAEDISSRHLAEALAGGHGKVINQKVIVKALRKANGTWAYENLRDRVIDGVKDMSGYLVYNILKNEEDMQKVAPRLGRSIQKISDEDLLSLAYTHVGGVEKLVNLFGERLKRLPPASMMTLLKQTHDLKSLESTVKSMGGWDHVLRRILEGRSPECGMIQWGELAWVLEQYGTMDRFVEKLSGIKEEHPQAEILARFLRASAKNDLYGPLALQVNDILSGNLIWGSN
jgi:hypothetical protein